MSSTANSTSVPFSYIFVHKLLWGNVGRIHHMMCCTRFCRLACTVQQVITYIIAWNPTEIFTTFWTHLFPGNHSHLSCYQGPKQCLRRIEIFVPACTFVMCSFKIISFAWSFLLNTTYMKSKIILWFTKYALINSWMMFFCMTPIFWLFTNILTINIHTHVFAYRNW